MTWHKKPVKIMKTLELIYFIFVLICLNACNGDNSKSSFAAGSRDTLFAAYTYWWPAGGPFIGLCGDPYSLVFTGTVSSIEEITATEKADKIVPKKGTITIKEMLYKSDPKDAKNPIKFHSQKYFSSDCFYGKQFKKGDKVLVFVYSYEGEYSIPPNSILKLNSFEEAAVGSIKTYIKNSQNPLSIKDDLKIWKEYGFDEALEQLIECKLHHK